MVLVLGLCRCAVVASPGDGGAALSSDAAALDADAAVPGDARAAADSEIAPVADGGPDASLADASPPLDATPADLGWPDAAPADAGDELPLTECAIPSIDRLTDWSAPEGDLETASGVRYTLLVPEGASGHYVARVHFLGSDWHAALVSLTNANVSTPRSEAIVDASASPGMVVTYSATSDLWVQLRSYDSFGGPNLYAASLPSTNGQISTLHLSFDRSITAWNSLFQAPDLSYPETLTQLRAVTFVDNSENELAFYGLRIQGYEPACPP